MRREFADERVGVLEVGDRFGPGIHDRGRSVQRRPLAGVILLPLAPDAIDLRVM